MLIIFGIDGSPSSLCIIFDICIVIYVCVGLGCVLCFRLRSASRQQPCTFAYNDKVLRFTTRDLILENSREYVAYTSIMVLRFGYGVRLYDSLAQLSPRDIRTRSNFLQNICAEIY